MVEEAFTIEFGVDSDDSDEESDTSEDECDNIAPTQPVQSTTTPTRQITPQSRLLIRHLQADAEFMNNVVPLPWFLHPFFMSEVILPITHGKVY